MAAGIELRADALRSLAFGSISGTYANIGTSFEHPMRILQVQNLTDATLTFSFDGGLIDHFVLPSMGFLLIDVTSNNQGPSYQFLISIGTQMAVKGTPGSGSVYVSAFYARGS